ncbi:N-acetylmuramoyl-L-alanine amidase [Ruania halotolerans]|uniref:N-acetylmuramoyl-L-alanine amidase n=1 Tax=Ruania halotolerans TaxID=2897773 RepID=UPI001E5D5062|nr:N-acetylmuramoyl-L-alanine amidase [Ruania halotolerans]UFU04864.1 N-acetylmuramoyl-L-alanine amidase [Ruania halotolerans]
MHPHLRRWACIPALALAGLLAVAPAAGATGDSDEDVKRVGVGIGERPLVGVRVAIDPGHNGENGSHPEEINERVPDGRGGEKACNTVGTTSTTGYPEHAFTFDVATRLADELRAQGASVFLTREDDRGVGPCVDRRGTFAEDNDVDLLLSLHANGSADPDQQGFFAIVADPPLSESQEQPSQDLALAMVDALEDAGFAQSDLDADGVIERDDLATLNFARRPATLIELGEMRNVDEAAVMESTEGRQQYADALAEGVRTWVDEHR